MAGAAAAPAAPAAPTPSGQGDTFSQAQTDINNSRAQLLAAMAQAGSAGKAAYDQAIQQVGQQKQDAVSQALKAATAGEAPGTLAAITGMVSAPYDRTATDLGSAQASRAASMQERQAGANTYLDEALAAVPAMRNAAELHLADLRAKAEQQAQAAQTSEALKQMSLQLESMRLQHAGSSGGLTPYQAWEIGQQEAKQGDPSTIIANQGGANQLGDLLYRQGSGFAAAKTPANVLANPAALLFGQSGGTPDAGTWAGALGSQMGLPAPTAQQLAAGSPASKADQANDAVRVAQNSIGQTARAGNPFGIPAGKTITAEDVLPIIASNYGLAIANQIATLYGKGGAIVTPAKGG